jgi:hypothetical protein
MNGSRQSWLHREARHRWGVGDHAPPVLAEKADPFDGQPFKVNNPYKALFVMHFEVIV